VERRPAVEFSRVDLAVLEHLKGKENAGRDLQKQLLVQPDVVTPPYCYDLHVTKVTTKVTTGYDGKGRSSEARAPCHVM
jgi:hypothetical protein